MQKQHHPSVQHLLSLFTWDHLPPALQSIVMPIATLAEAYAETLESGPELSVGLRHLLDAKDALVRQKVIDLREANTPAPANTPEPFITNASTYPHKPGCRWLALTPTECVYRATHHYCPHPEHACTCSEETSNHA